MSRNRANPFNPGAATQPPVPLFFTQPTYLQQQPIYWPLPMPSYPSQGFSTQMIPLLQPSNRMTQNNNQFQYPTANNFTLTVPQMLPQPTQPPQDWFNQVLHKMIDQVIPNNKKKAYLSLLDKIMTPDVKKYESEVSEEEFDIGTKLIILYHVYLRLSPSINNNQIINLDELQHIILGSVIIGAKACNDVRDLFTGDFKKLLPTINLDFHEIEREHLKNCNYDVNVTAKKLIPIFENYCDDEMLTKIQIEIKKTKKENDSQGIDTDIADYLEKRNNGQPEQANNATRKRKIVNPYKARKERKYSNESKTTQPLNQHTPLGNETARNNNNQNYIAVSNSRDQGLSENLNTSSLQPNEGYNGQNGIPNLSEQHHQPFAPQIITPEDRTNTNLQPTLAKNDSVYDSYSNSNTFNFFNYNQNQISQDDNNEDRYADFYDKDIGMT